MSFIKGMPSTKSELDPVTKVNQLSLDFCNLLSAKNVFPERLYPFGYIN